MQAKIIAEFYLKKLGKEAALKVMSLYHIGTSKHWMSCNCILSFQGRSKEPEKLCYDRELFSCKTFPHITWYINLELKITTLQCLFGEHLLKITTKTYRSRGEKTAILAAYRPDLIGLQPETSNLK
jgi:hypothetical protein